MATAERRALCALFAEVGPDAPTLCGTWTTKDLAAHLVIRERRPDTAPGILLPFAREYTQRVQDAYARKPWPQLVDLVRTGPPRLLRPVDGAINGAEYFVHHEDVRRATAGWEPRTGQQDTLWRIVQRTAPLNLRKSAVGVVLNSPGHGRKVARKGEEQVTVSGAPGELLLFLFGREQVKLEFDGAARAIDALRASDRAV
jgi:uncharacterized protein (TIGR03085 family)